jgi:formamidopyrimidine-DNA glycosylase
VGVKGKFSYWRWKDKHGNFVWDQWVQYGMSGYFCSPLYFEKEIPHIRTPERAKDCSHHGHIWFFFENGPLVFSDMRNFGNITWTDNHQETIDYLHNLGPDPLVEDLTPQWWDKIKKTIKPTKFIADSLLDQSFVSGIGNYLRSEILWKAGIYPGKSWGDLSEDELDRFYHAIGDVTREKGDEVSLTFWVYQAKEDPNGNPVKGMKWKGRTIWFAPNIQKK